MTCQKQTPRRIARATCLLRLDIGKSRIRKVKPIDEGVDEAHRIICTDIVIKQFRQEQCLRSVVTGDVGHAAILAWRAPHRNPLRGNFHTVCKGFTPCPICWCRSGILALLARR